MKEPVDIVIFHDRHFQEPWFLLPADSEKPLPTDEVVALDRQRMHIELTFRDWKTHLGVRGLHLEVDPSLRLGRLLLGLTCAYMLAVLVGAGEIAATVRTPLRSTAFAPKTRNAAASQCPLDRHPRTFLAPLCGSPP